MFFRRFSARPMALGGVIGGVAFTLGWWIGHGAPVSTLSFPARPVFAASSDSTDDLSIATGLVAEDVEGFFALDGLSGDLQCTVYNSNAQSFNVIFRRNTLADLQIDATKSPRFVMTTGTVEPWRRGGRNIGSSFIYVAEATSGRFAAYAVPWRRELFVSGRPQQGELVLIQTGSVRTAVVRE